MTSLRLLASSDLGATVVPLPASFGEYGTTGGIAAMLERSPGPALWLDVGDLVVGSPATPLTGRRPWEEVADLPIAAAAAGNHEFDDGLEALHAAVPSLGYPLLCANADAGLPATAIIDTEAGPLGVIGLTHPQIHRSSRGPAPFDDWRVGELARELRAGGARWVVALLHDGVEWWPVRDGIATRADRLEALVAAWAADVDLILCGHNFGAWTGTLAGAPAGEPYLFASSVLVVDLDERVVVRGVERVTPLRPARRTPAVEAIEAAAADVLGESAHDWLARTGARRYLPDLLARAMRDATGADAALAPPGMHGTQPPIDGAVGALREGPITKLDLVRLLPDEYDPVMVELAPGEFGAAVDAHDRAADPANRSADGIWWNWCRMRIGVSAGEREPRTLAVAAPATKMLSEWLGRDVEGDPTGVRAHDALLKAAR